ncbi:MAG: hypothetical protein M1839_008831 [Geoglossum umbratile]|nr:MAG: hypothetical protein M1839_008831 [Geoglossum umbratile]
MNTQNSLETGGGFLPPALPLSPVSVTTSSTLNSTLPYPRSHPLKPGSAKETAFIQYVDKGMLGVTRRYAKKFSEGFGGGDERSYAISAPIPTGETPQGYDSIEGVCMDLEKLVDVIWVSGTPSLQVQYLLSVALLLTSYLPSFPALPRPTFRLLKKLDTAFASLLRGHNIDTGEVLGGFMPTAGKVSITDMVRLKSLVERTRVVVVDVIGREEAPEEWEYENDDGDDDGDDRQESGGEGMKGQEGGNRWEMEIARVYDQTIVELGELLRNSVEGGV